MKLNKQKILRYGISIIIMILIVWYFVSSDFDFQKTWEIIRGANFLWVFVPIPIMILSHWIRAMRWKTMLKPILKPGSVWNLFSAVMVGYAINNIIPRGGEFVRPYVYAKREKVSYSSVFATIIVERFLDVIVLLLLFLGAFLLMRDKILETLPQEFDTNSVLFVILLFIIVLLFSFYPPFVRNILKLTIKPVSKKLYLRILELFEKFLKGFAIIKRPSQYFRLTVESLAIWLCYALPMYIMFFSFEFQSRVVLGMEDALFLLIVSGIGITLAPTPGGIGIYHSLIVAAMTQLYPINREEALAYATVTHGINFFVQVVIGVLFLFRENIKKLPQKDDLSVEIESVENDSG